MTRRANYAKLSPNLLKKFQDFSQALTESSIETGLREIVNLRTSQLNGCAFCLDMHVKAARIAGERELKLHHVAIWRESALFSARERAALEWAEALAVLSSHGVPDEVYDRVSAALSEREFSDLTFVVMAINGWNRASIGFRTPPGALDKLYGLDKAGLS